MGLKYPTRAEAAVKRTLFRSVFCSFVLPVLALAPIVAASQGVTTSALTGIVSGQDGQPIPSATVTAVHVPSGTQYRATVTSTGRYNLPNLRVGGPYRITATSIGYEPRSESDITLALGQASRVDFKLNRAAVTLEGVTVTAEKDALLNAGRTGASMTVTQLKVAVTPSIKRSTRDLTKLDPRSDGNMSFAGRNWLYNNISVDGSYFNNPYGLDDPAPGLFPTMPSRSFRYLSLHSTCGKAGLPARTSTPLREVAPTSSAGQPTRSREMMRSRETR
jgi:hypothetical protein